MADEKVEEMEMEILQNEDVWKKLYEDVIQINDSLQETNRELRDALQDRERLINTRNHLSEWLTEANMHSDMLEKKLRRYAKRDRTCRALNNYLVAESNRLRAQLAECMDSGGGNQAMPATVEEGRLRAYLPLCLQQRHKGMKCVIVFLVAVYIILIHAVIIMKMFD